MELNKSLPPQEAPEESVSTLSDEIISIIAKFIAKNQGVFVDRLYKVARRATGADPEAIENVIDRLIREKVIVPGSKITRNTILTNQTRRQIFVFMSMLNRILQ